MLKFITLSALFMGLAFAAESESSSESSTDESSSDESSSESTTATTTASATATTTASAIATTTTTYASQLRNDIDCNYYYSTLDASSFAFAIGQCTLYSTSGTYMKATCLDTDHLQVDTYFLPTCGDTSASTTIYTSENATFYCGGVSGYAKITISFLECSDTTYDVYSALNTCTNVSSIIYTSVYCSSSYGEIQYYLYDDTCSDSAFYKVAKMNTTCGFLFTSSGSKVYGKIGACSTTGSISSTATPTVATTDGTSGATYYNIYNVIALLFVAIVYATAL